MLAKEKPFFEVDGFDEHTFLYAEEPILTERCSLPSVARRRVR